MRAIYTIGIWLYTLGIRTAALFGHEKARLMVQGWSKVAKCHRPPATDCPLPTVWFHASSLGEFEQARPVLEAYRRRHPDCRVLLTFFSPSGYELRKNYPMADTVVYLPMDLPGNVHRFLDTYRPTVAFFVKYDFWFNYLGQLHRRGIPTYLFSSLFRSGQYFFRPWGRWFLHQLNECYTHIFVQNDASLQLLRRYGIERCSLAGDTRIDRVHQIALAAENDATVEHFLNGHDGPVLIGGSTWPPDEQIISSLTSCHSSLKIILAPHVIAEEHLRQIEHLFPDSIRYSALKDHTDTKDSKTLIIDNIGLLSKLYRYATVAYIGGGFGVGIHNLLEAVTFGKPVLFGPNYRKFQEAHDLLACGGGFSHSDADTLHHNLQPLLTDPDAYRRASQACLDYMKENLGSTDIILNTIEN